MTNCSVSTVVVPRNVFAMLPSYNPFVGTFHHAPSAGNRGAAFFSGDIVGMAELEERKKFRHHPLTGTFHSLPGYYDPLHRLSQFRQDGDDADHLSQCDTDSVRSFVAVDLADTEDVESGLTIGQPKSLSRMYSDSTFGTHGEHLDRPRRFSDADAESFFSNQQQQQQQHHAYPPTVGPSSADSALRRRRSKMLRKKKSQTSSDPENELEDVVMSPPRSRSKTLPNARLSVSVRDASDELVLKPRKSSSGSAHSTESDSSSFEALVHSLVDRPDLMRSVSESELNDGFISTGKGIFRKVGYRLSASERERLGDKERNGSTKPSSPSRIPLVNWVNDELAHAGAEEYTQAAPRVPLNPFVARRLTDGEEIRIMPVHRQSARRESVPHVVNPGSDTDDESSSHPKPYFIHERAVTEQYELVGADQLGDGSYAVVKPAIRRANGKEVAIKQIHKRYLTTEESKSGVEREIEIHLRLKHRNIVRLHEVYETEDFLYLVMSKAKKGNLKQLMQRKRRLSEALAAKLAQQIVRAVFFLHDSGVLHCDLKPENILLTDARVTNQDTNDSTSPVNRRRGSLVNSLDPHADVKVCDLQVELCDFGLSVKVPDVRFYKLTGDVHKVPFTGVTGTPGYIAPELLQQQPYGKPVDMWSVGIVIYEMLTGYQPFYPPHACIHEKADFNDRVWKSISVQAKDLVMRLLESDPSKRLTAADALSHGWFDTATFAI
ncbi:hypothetical protein PINS_up001776 [Pythium insidiosum]|nr:hypothetical protein PINS_up001776 [Pythium insidiosum]